ncbi:MAG: hypothetical protein NC126_04490 [Clostridium sp.]|nr:hypothetical protein [Clostridium sp.]
MANKFGKFLLFTAAVGTVAAAVYYYRQKKENEASFDEDDDDYDNFFSEDTEKSSDVSRNYVPLNPEAAPHTESASTNFSEKLSEVAGKVSEVASNVKETFTPLAEKAVAAVQTVHNKTEETVENFFDEGDSDDESVSANARTEESTESLFDDMTEG